MIGENVTYLEVLISVKNFILNVIEDETYICSEIHHTCSVNKSQNKERFIKRFQYNHSSIPEIFKGRYWIDQKQLHVSSSWWSYDDAFENNDVKELNLLKVAFLNYLIDLEQYNLKR